MARTIDPEAGQLEEVSAADLAVLEHERAAAQARLSASPALPTPPADLPRWQPPPLEVDTSGTPAVISLARSKLDLKGADRAARERIRKLLDDTKQAFLAGAEWAAVLELRQRRTAAEAKLADARQALAGVEGEHRTAAAAGQAEAAKLWKRALQLRDDLAGAEAALAGVNMALQTAERKAAAALSQAIAQARETEGAAIRQKRAELHEQLLAAVKPLVEALAGEQTAVSELRRATDRPVVLPS